MAKNVLISDYAWFQEGPGVRNTQYTMSGVKLLNVANLVDGKLDLSTSQRFISEEEAYGRYKHFLVDEGDFIIASSGIQIDYFDKKMGFVSKEQLPLCMNTSTIRFKSLDKKVLNMKYFMYYLKSTSFKSQLSKYIVGSAQLNFGPSHLKKMYFPLVDIVSQQEIVQKLSQIDRLISLRKKQLQKLDDFVKSRFIEMFGDRLSNNKGWKVSKLGEVTDFYNGKAHEQVIEENGEFVLVTSKCIATNGKEVRRTNDLLFPLIKGDICMVMSDVPNGRALAKCMYIEMDHKYSLNQRICCFRNYHQNVTYFFHLLNRHEYFLSFNDGDSQTNLRKDEILDCPIILPPMELQEAFANIVEQVKATQLTVNRGLDKFEQMKQALMQKYFG